MRPHQSESESAAHTRQAHRIQSIGETIFATMSARALATGAYNLGQGFPDASGPPRALEIAAEEIAAGNNQYGPGRGNPALREAIANQRQRDYGLTYDPDSEVLVTVGATEAITAAVLGLVNPGEEVIVLEPFYDAYAAAISLAGAQRVAVPLREVSTTQSGAQNDDDSTSATTWTLDIAAIEAAMSDKTAMVLINSPHNPTGSVFDREALEQLAWLCCQHDVLLVADEVYENLLFDEHVHVPIASLPGMRERTITISSAAKSFNVTGWKTGWALAPAELIDAVLRVKQYLSFVGVSHVQPAIAHALNHESQWQREMVANLAVEKDLLVKALNEAGLRTHATAGTYFVIADAVNLGFASGRELCETLLEKCNIAAIPVQDLCDDGSAFAAKVRFAFCKDAATMAAARDALTSTHWA